MNIRVNLLSLVLAIFAINMTLRADNEGQDKLDEATSLKMETDADLGKVIELCEEALEAGLDEGNTSLAKQILAASALERAQRSIDQVQRIADNPAALRRLRRRTVSDLDMAIENDPELPEAYVLRARIQNLPGGNPAGAMKDLDSAIELLKDRPTDQSQALTLRALLRRDNDAKLADLAKAIVADPGNVAAWQARIALQKLMGRFEDVVRDAEELLEKDDTNMFALAAAVEALRELKEPDKAIELVTKRIENDPKNGVAYRFRAGAYMEKEDFVEALADLNEAIEIDSLDALALLMRGQVYFEQKEDAKASRDISDALRIQPASVHGVWMRSLVAVREGRFSDAITDMETLVRADPSNADWIRRLASLYQADDRPRLAISLLDQLIGSNDQDWAAIRRRGDAKLSISQHVEAIKDFEQAIQILERYREELDDEDKELTDRDYSGVLNNLSWVLATSPKEELRNGERAVELGLKACEASEYAEAHILSTLGAAYAEVGDFENARKWSSKAVELEEAKEKPDEQLKQLKEELEKYKKEEPWREEQTTEENDKPLSAPSKTIDT